MASAPTAAGSDHRPAKRAKGNYVSFTDSREKIGEHINIQSALGVHDESDEADDHALLRNVLSFLAISTELVRIRGVCRALRRNSDEMARANIARLVGENIRPMIGQSVVALLHGAEGADDLTRKTLREWKADVGRAEGFEVGLPTKKGNDQRWHVMALIPCDPIVPSASVPVKLRLDYQYIVSAPEANERSFIGVMPYLPKGFFHMNAYPSGLLTLCNSNHLAENEKDLNDSLRRIKSNIGDHHSACPHDRNPYYIWAGSWPGVPSNRFPGVKMDDDRYKGFVRLCMLLFTGYKLGMPTPNLDAFQVLVQTQLDLFKMTAKAETVYV